MDVDVPFRLATALFVICAPTALFLGLWHGLTALRDDDLAGEVTARQLRGVFDALPSGHPDAGRFERVEVPDSSRPRRTAAESADRIEVGVEPDPIECSRCTESNPPVAELCWGCGAYLNRPDATE